jgi:hypothetical protein
VFFEKGGETELVSQVFLGAIVSGAKIILDAFLVFF